MTPPTRERLEIANSFFLDATDLLARYRLTTKYFSAIKSRRVKLFVDLRLAYECILKAHLAYFDEQSSDRKMLIRKVELFRHDVERLLGDIIPFLSDCLAQRGQLLNKELALLPISLRYYLDVCDFLEAKNDLYYATIGRDCWMEGFAEFIRTLTDQMNKNLQSHSHIVGVGELWDVMNHESYNKYLPPRDTV